MFRSFVFLAIFFEVSLCQENIPAFFPSWTILLYLCLYGTALGFTMWADSLVRRAQQTQRMEYAASQVVMPQLHIVRSSDIHGNN